MRHLLLLSFLVFANALFAVTYTKSTAGNYSNTGGWSPSYPGTTIGSGDVVIINAAVTMNVDLTIEGTLTINSGASLIGTNKEIKEIKAGGILNVNGTLTAKKIDKIKGTANINGAVTVTGDMKVEDNGSIVIGSSGSLDADKLEIKDDGALTVNGSITISDELKLKDDAVVDFNNGSTSSIKDVKVEDDADFEVKAGADITITNDLEVKDDAKLTVAGTLTVHDDIEFKDDANINITGVLNLCDPTGTVGENKFEVENDVNFTGSGTYCACSSNDDNDYDNNSNNQGSITFNQNCNGPLPIELIKFETQLISENQIEIKWTTASEINNAFFLIEYSFDTKNWNLLKELNGAGTSNRKNAYVATHDISNITNSIIYYRIKNVDYDGRFAYSWINSVTLRKETTELPNRLSTLKIYPNPSKTSSLIYLESNNSELINEIMLISVDGQYIEFNWTVVDETTIEFNSTDLNAGLYKVIIVGESVQLHSTIQITR